MEEESDLCIFKGLKGFENSDDSTLVALLDDLHEDTLLTLLEDNLFAKELCGHPFEGEDEGHLTLRLDSPLCSVDTESSTDDTKNHGECLSSVRRALEGNKRLRNDNMQENILKKIKLDAPAKSLSTLASVMHDHCYASLQEDRDMSNSNSDEETSNEEGSSSDTGYDTMSSSTSPRSGNSADGKIGPLDHQLLPPTESVSPRSHLALPVVVDPVALIDERIKHYMCSREVNLTEEEKEILKAEGLPLPTTLPLTKVEERALKNVRRKIRNRVAAQESRKRKKELMHTLEDRVSDYSHENVYLKKRVQALEMENKSLVEQLKKLQAMVSSCGSNSGHAKVGTCIMVVVLCFAVFYGGSSPSNLWSSHAEYATAAVRSRSLLSVNAKVNFPASACDWFKQIFMREQELEFSVSTTTPPSSAETHQQNISCPIFCTNVHFQ